MGGRLWVGQQGFPPGLLGFDNPSSPGPFPVVATPTGDTVDFPDLHDIDEIVSFAGTLWGASGDASAIFGFLDPASVESDQFPDVVLSHPSMDEPKALHIEERP